LNLGVGGRAFGMGGAQVASVKDVSSGYWNPAGLRNLPSDFQVSLMHNEYFGGLAKYDHIGVAAKLNKNKGNIGVNILRFGVDDIPYTINLITQEGVIDFNQINNTFAAIDYAAIISYSKDLKIKKWKERDDRSLTIGANTKIINRQLGKLANAWGIGVDIGLKLNAKRWQAGLVLRDATTTYTGWNFSLTEREKFIFQETGNVIPVKGGEVMRPRLSLGLARNFPINNAHQILAEVNTDMTTDGARYGQIININPVSISPRLGVEYVYKNQFFVRGGVGNFQNVLDNTDSTFKTKRVMYQPSFGVGMYLNNLTIDYAFSSLNLQSNPLYSHIISLKLDIRKPKRFRKDTNKKDN
jgi:hypothetical protein